MSKPIISDPIGMVKNPIYVEYYSHDGCTCYKIDLPWTRFHKETLVLCDETLGYEHAKELARKAIAEHLECALAEPVKGK